MIVVTLSQPEMIIGSSWGKKRNQYSTERGHVPLNNQPTDKVLSNDIFGSLCELAACKYLNVYWEPTMFEPVDIKPNIQIRGSTNKHGDLIIRFKDDPSHKFILVTQGSQSNIFLIIGWIMGEEGKKSTYLKAHAGRPPAYFIPQYKLNQFNHI